MERLTAWQSCSLGYSHCPTVSVGLQDLPAGLYHSLLCEIVFQVNMQSWQQKETLWAYAWRIIFGQSPCRSPSLDGSVRRHLGQLGKYKKDIQWYKQIRWPKVLSLVGLPTEWPYAEANARRSLPGYSCNVQMQHSKSHVEQRLLDSSCSCGVTCSHCATTPPCPITNCLSRHLTSWPYFWSSALKESKKR